MHATRQTDPAMEIGDLPRLDLDRHRLGCLESASGGKAISALEQLARAEESITSPGWAAYWRGG